MENKETAYEAAIGYLKRTPPVLDNPSELTQRIMASVERLAVRRRRDKIMRIAGALSGVAACAAFCLLACEMAIPSAHRHAAGVYTAAGTPSRQAAPAARAARPTCNDASDVACKKKALATAVSKKLASRSRTAEAKLRAVTFSKNRIK